jgi:hypothetical protein
VRISAFTALKLDDLALLEGDDPRFGFGKFPFEFGQEIGLEVESARGVSLVFELLEFGLGHFGREVAGDFGQVLHAVGEADFDQDQPEPVGPVGLFPEPFGGAAVAGTAAIEFVAVDGDGLLHGNGHGHDLGILGVAGV